MPARNETWQTSLTHARAGRQRLLRVPPPQACKVGRTSGAASDVAPAETLADLTASRIQDVSHTYHLSRRETDVFALLAQGRSIPYIAETLVISENTVRSHAQRIYAKLDVHSKQQLLDLVQGTDDGR